ncbi:MAG: Asp23/Gls24 family envelope stress response protein [Oscillospiraceae bacterium]|jgi:uncharacterized alkaline shock family protein YloU|nr:Asp23/Gls24 family envelope stress response protein [Oscillospiraceae bacterium]
MAENYITRVEEGGSINISDDVIATMVKTAVKEVESVSGLTSTAGPAVAELLSKKSTAKGIKIQFDEDAIIIDTAILVKYGSNVVNVAKAVQENVTNAVQSMTGLEQVTVNVHVSGVAFEK